MQTSDATRLKDSEGTMGTLHGIPATTRPLRWPRAAIRSSPLFILVSDLMVLALTAPALLTAAGEPQTLDDLRLILAGTMVAWAMTMGHYTRRVVTAAELGHLVQVTCLVALADAGGIYHWTGQWELPAVAVRWLAVLVLVYAARVATRRLLTAAGLWQIPVLVVGGANAHRIAAALGSSRSRGYRSVGVLALDDTTQEIEPAVEAVCHRTTVQMAVLEPEQARGELGRRLARILRARGIDIALAPSLGEVPVLGLQVQNFFSHDVVLLTNGPAVGRGVGQAAKRLMDILGSGLLLLALAPALALIAVAVKADGGPMLFGHWRVGQNGRPFRCWKFRSMVPNAEAVLKDLLAADPAAAEEWRRTQKLKADPRVTAIGGFLRRSSLDELPQLANVLLGEMSLIGPRPVTKGELEHYGEAQDYYLSVRPGITGLWQVLGRNDTSYGQRVLLDAWYVRNWSLWHDLIILIKTIPAVLRRNGAY